MPFQDPEDEAFAAIEAFDRARHFVGPERPAHVPSMTFAELQLEYSRTHPPIPEGYRHFRRG